MFGFNVYEKPVEQCFDYALQHKITHLEIDLNARHSLLRSFTPERIECLRRLTAQTGIQLSFHTPIDINLSGNYFIRRPYVKMLKAIMQLAHQLNAIHVTCHIGHFHDVKPWPWQRLRMLKRAAHCIDSVLEACGDSQVIVALENS
ncbi:sugar phosphate isomerase/epimerase, partial [bacterium]|nr:sugar phosphate isomerase/epimerase [bacterium]